MEKYVFFSFMLSFSIYLHKEDEKKDFDCEILSYFHSGKTFVVFCSFERVHACAQKIITLWF